MVVPPFRRMPEALRRVLNAELEGVPRAELPRFVHVHPEEATRLQLRGAEHAERQDVPLDGDLPLIIPMRPVEVSDLPAAPQEESGYNDLQRVLATHRAAIDNAITVYAEVIFAAPGHSELNMQLEGGLEGQALSFARSLPVAPNLYGEIAEYMLHMVRAVRLPDLVVGEHIAEIDMLNRLVEERIRSREGLTDQGEPDREPHPSGRPAGGIDSRPGYTSRTTFLADLPLWLAETLSAAAPPDRHIARLAAAAVPEPLRNALPLCGDLEPDCEEDLVEDLPTSSGPGEEPDFEPQTPILGPPSEDAMSSRCSTCSYESEMDAVAVRDFWEDAWDRVGPRRRVIPARPPEDGVLAQPLARWLARYPRWGDVIHRREAETRGANGPALRDVRHETRPESPLPMPEGVEPERRDVWTPDWTEERNAEHERWLRNRRPPAPEELPRTWRPRPAPPAGWPLAARTPQADWQPLAPAPNAHPPTQGISGGTQTRPGWSANQSWEGRGQQRMASWSRNQWCGDTEETQTWSANPSPGWQGSGQTNRWGGDRQRADSWSASQPSGGWSSVGPQQSGWGNAGSAWGGQTRDASSSASGHQCSSWGGQHPAETQWGALHQESGWSSSWGGQQLAESSSSEAQWGVHGHQNSGWWTSIWPSSQEERAFAWQ